MNIILSFVFLFILSSCASLSSDSKVENGEVRTIKTFTGMKQENVVMQRYDFSCGISSLLTLMKYHFGGDYPSEKKMLTDFLDNLSEEKKREVLEKGLSVFDLKTLSENFGYAVYAVKLEKKSLFKIDRPVLVYLETSEYKHFSV